MTGRGRLILPLLVFLFGAAVWAVVVLQTRFTLEDAYITFRYARNIVLGRGFVFNTGERVLGTTTPLQTLMLAVAALPFGPDSVPAAAAVLMPLAGLLAGLVGYLALTRAGIAPGAAAIGMALAYTNVALIRTGIGGMETPLVLTLMAMSLWALVSAKDALAGLLAGLLVLTRIDGLIWASLVLGAIWLSRRRGALAATGVLALTLLPWVVFATGYFGSLLPNSMLAKGVVRPGMENALLDPSRMLAYLKWFAGGTGVRVTASLFLPWAALVALGAWRVLRQGRRELWLLVVFPLLYALLMYLGRAPRYEWYLSPMTFCCVFLAGAGVWALLAELGGAEPAQARALTRVLDVILVLAVIAAAIRAPLGLARLKRAQENEDGLRRAAGVWLKAHTPQDASVAMEAIGYQGYFSDRRIVDMAGLVTPKVVEYKRRTSENGRIFEWIRRDLKPHYIVLRSFEVDENRHFNGGPLFLTPQARAEFFRTYAEAERLSAPYPEARPLVSHLTIYRRR